MNTEAERAPSPRARQNGRIAGAIIAAASVSSVLLMAHHPSVASHAMADAVAEIAAKAWTTRFVHGALIAVMGALLFGFIELSSLLGMHRLSVRAALLAYAIGSASMTGAALISGFLVPKLASHYSNSSAADLDALRHLLVLSTIGNRTLANFGVAAMSTAILLWSTALLRSRAAVASIGALGLLLAAGQVVALVSGVIELEVTGMTIIVTCQTVWNLAVAVPLVQRKLG